MPQKHYNYIITGMGCAGLSLAMHLIKSDGFRGKKILLVDEEAKQTNDRTWCFWESGENIFEPIVHHCWQKLWFYGEAFSKELSIAPYTYKMIRGLDFYQYCLKEIKKHSAFEILLSPVDSVFSNKKTGIIVKGETIYADYIFNSILFKKPLLSKKQVMLLQHFKGWVIETEQRAFNPEVATLMDFRISQQHGTTFCYVLPITENKALVEYTLFTASLLERDEYDKELKHYIEEMLQLKNYTVLHKEFGVIPMTDYQFIRSQKNIINIGTAGGQTKGSSGYTFYFIQNHSAAIVESLLKTGKPFVTGTPWRFGFYDSVLLSVLYNNRLPGKSIFTDFFKKNKPQKVLRFLNNESSLSEELGLISSLPTLPFLKSAIKKFI
jgi:lycopene beta-cyclase